MNPREIIGKFETTNLDPTSGPGSNKNCKNILDLRDDQIDTSDIPEWTEDNWARAKKGFFTQRRKEK